MFRLGKRNFSLRESPGKLSSISSSPKVVNSPIKRLKISAFNNSQIISSTFLHESKIGEESFNEANTTCEISDEKQPQATVENGSKVSAETPPLTPICKIESRADALSKQKIKLDEETNELDLQLERKLKEIAEIKCEINTLRADRFVYEDYANMAARGQNEIRDLLNQIYYPGTELAKAAETFIKELLSKHERKLDNLHLELNNLMDTTENAICGRIKTLHHEIDLHQRTLVTIESSRQQEQEHEQEQEQKQEQGEKNTERFGKRRTDDDGQRSNGFDCTKEDNTDTSDDNEDCVILDDRNSEVVSIRSNDGSMNLANSRDLSETRTENNADDEETDIEENQGDDSRSFTPCQAQRLEQ